MEKWTPETDGATLRRAGKTAEEASELIKVLQRIIIQGYGGRDPETGEPNEDALAEEIADVYAQLDETVKAFNLNPDFIARRRDHKRELMRQWEAHFNN